MSAATVLVGVDVGGTFTDLLAYDAATGSLQRAKVPSLPGAQWRGVLQALDQLGIAPGQIRAVVHGTTISTNALLERKGARTALLTTEGFRDVVEIGKGRRLVGGLFDIGWQRPAPLVPRALRLEARERIAADGAVIRPLDSSGFAQLVQQLRAQQVQALAVAFINAYVNPGHEQRAAEVLANLAPDLPVSCSAALCAERGEFERTSTCVLNAYLTPIMVQYLRTLDAALRDARIEAPVSIMGSNGGAMSLELAATRSAATFLSGPVGGVVGAVRVAAGAGVRDIITFDMGGTSTDVALVHELEPRMSHDNQVDAYPLKVPQLDIHTIGAGGGSIVHLHADGTLAVGPHSAGAVPGPACYARGGSAPTISDANLLLGRLPTRRALAGGLRLDPAAARAAFEPLAAALGADAPIEALADAAIRIAVARMAGAVREVSVHRGFDPRAFALLGFGGAGPMHVFLVARELEIPRVLIPPFPGHLSALGQMAADVRKDLVEAWGGPLSRLREADLRAHVAALQRQGEQALERESVPRDRQHMAVSLDMRYAGQSFTLAVSWHPEDTDLSLARGRFDALHERNFGYGNPAAEVEVVNLRLVATGIVDKPGFAPPPATAATSPPGERRPVWFGGWRDTPVHDRGQLGLGSRLGGPLVIEEDGGTTVVPPGWSVEVLPCGTLGCDSDP